MLDFQSVVAQLRAAAHEAPHNQKTIDELCHLWRAVCSEFTEHGNLRGSEHADFPIPVTHIFTPSQRAMPYTVCGVDGSQVYPDRHTGVWAYLINTSTVVFSYGSVTSTAQYSSVPEVRVGGAMSMMTPDMVNGFRTEREFAAGRAWAQQTSGDSRYVFFDGSLIFWHLLSKEPGIKNRFLTSYCTILKELAHTGAITAAYISKPNSRELLQLLQWYGVRTGVSLDRAILETLTDSDILSHVLAAGETTPLFEHRFDLAELYGHELTPHFFYLNTGDEIARIELLKPHSSPEQLAALVTVLRDQIEKGNGYPIALAEAHEYAVVRSGDREFFELMLTRICTEQGGSAKMSQKLARKRSATI